LRLPRQAQKKDGFRWWAQRLGRAFHMHNETRIDHFRGFAGYWAVPSTAETAIDGKWRKGPGKELFDALTEVRVLEPVCLIAPYINPYGTALWCPRSM